VQRLSLICLRIPLLGITYIGLTGRLQVFMDQDSAAPCNVGFPPITVASGYFGYVVCHQFYLGVLGLHVVAFGLFC
jgi:hypothetical protein